MDVEKNTRTRTAVKSVPGVKFSILGGDAIGYCEEKKAHINRPNCVRFLFVGLEEDRSLQKKDGYTRRIARSGFGCCCPYKKT
jgi:hypothetical protein